MFRRIISIALSIGLLLQQTGFCQLIGPQVPGGLISYQVMDRFRPVHLRYLSYEPKTENIRFILDKGDTKVLDQKAVAENSNKLLEYFQIGLAMPNSAFWVNLRPDAPDRIIDGGLAQTDVGKILLEADLELKKDVALFTAPTTPTGKEYWHKLYTRAEQVFGQDDDVVVPTYTRPWIVPGEIIIGADAKGAYIYKATLKVMLEQDYLQDSPEVNFTDARQKALNEYSSQLIRQLILPALAKEVNSSRKYAQLRQVYYSLILAQWFKAKSATQGSEVNALSKCIDSGNLAGLTSRTAWSKMEYFNAYRTSFQKGEYNIEEEVSGRNGISIRKYFSGGMSFENISSVVKNSATDFFNLQGIDIRELLSRLNGFITGSALMDQNARIEPPAAGRDNPAGGTFSAKDREYTIEFGTSGWRDKLTKDFNITNIRRAAQGVADFYNDQLEKGTIKDYEFKKGDTILIGFDPRGDNAEFAKEIASILAGNGIPVQIILAEPTPTPVLAYLANSNSKIAGVINLTASHNPYEDDGFKFSAYHGGAADKEVTAAVSKFANKAEQYKFMEFAEGLKNGSIKEMSVDSAIEQYVNEYIIGILKDIGAWDAIISYIKSNPDFKLILDPMQGTAVKYLKAIFTAIAKDSRRDFDDLVTVIHENNHDPKFTQVNGVPNPTLRSSITDVLALTQGKEKTMALLTDGDADRFGVVDFNGKVISANDLFELLVHFLIGEKNIDGNVGKTVSNSHIIDEIVKALGKGTNIIETGVGFKYYVEHAIKNEEKFVIAGESSAHIGIGPFMQSWDDGMAMVLAALWMVAEKGMSLSEYKQEIESKLGKEFFHKEDGFVITPELKSQTARLFELSKTESDTNVALKERAITGILKSLGMETQVKEINTKDGLKVIFTNGDWILWRLSGTEDKARLYTEVQDKSRQDYVRYIGRAVLGISEADYLINAGIFGNNVSEADRFDIIKKFATIGFEDTNARLGWVIPPAKNTVFKALNDMLNLEVMKGKKNFVFSGMGGSINTIKALIKILGRGDEFKIYTIDSLDPAALQELLDEIGDEHLKETLVVGISKSVTTKETQDLLKTMREKFQTQGLDSANHFLWMIDLPNIGNLDSTGWTGSSAMPIQVDAETDIGGRFTAPHTLIYLMPLVLLFNKDVSKLEPLWNEYTDIVNSFMPQVKKLVSDALEIDAQKFAIVVENEQLAQGLNTWVIQLFQESLGSKITGFNPKTIVTTQDKIPSGYFPIKFDIHSRKPLLQAMLNMYLLQIVVADLSYEKNLNFVTQPEVEKYKKAMSNNLPQALSATSFENIKIELPKTLQDKKNVKNIEVIAYWHAQEQELNEIQKELQQVFPDKEVSVFVGSDWNHHSYQAASDNRDTHFVILTKSVYQNSVSGFTKGTLVENIKSLRTIAAATYDTLKSKATSYELTDAEITGPEINNFRDVIQELFGNRLPKVQALVQQYNQAVANNAQTDKIEEEINDIIDQVNAYTNQNLFPADSLKLDDFLANNPAAASYKAKATSVFLNGGYVPEFIFAGAATRLFDGLEKIFGKGTLNPADFRMYGLDLWGILEMMKEKDNFEKLTKANPGLADKISSVSIPKDHLRLGMGQRQIVAYRQHIVNLALAAGKNIKDVLARQKIVLHISQEIEDSVLQDFVEKDFYGFAPENVMFIVQPAFAGFKLENGQMVYDPASAKLPYGHGFVLMQMARPGDAFTLDSKGNRHYLTESVIDKVNDAALIGTHRVNDLTKFLPETVANVDKIAFGLYLMDKENKDVIVELVDNPNKQKGGNLLQDSNGNKLLIETLNAKGSDKLKKLLEDIAKEGAPYNAFRLMIKPEVYQKVYAQEQNNNWLTSAEKSNLRFKNGNFYIETVGGNDITQSKSSNVEAILKKDEVIQDFKELNNFINTDAIQMLGASDEKLKEGLIRSGLEEVLGVSDSDYNKAYGKARQQLKDRIEKEGLKVLQDIILERWDKLLKISQYLQAGGYQGVMGTPITYDPIVDIYLTKKVGDFEIGVSKSRSKRPGNPRGVSKVNIPYDKDRDVMRDGIIHEPEKVMLDYTTEVFGKNKTVWLETNPFPIFKGHVQIVDSDSTRQKLNVEFLRAALELLPNLPDMTFYFNSQGANASQNHPHLQGIPNRKASPLDNAEMSKIGSIDKISWGTLNEKTDSFPVKAFVLEYADTNPTTLNMLATLLNLFLQDLSAREIPHNVLFKGNKGNNKNRIFIFPRSELPANEFGRSFAGAEYDGYLMMTAEELVFTPYARNFPDINPTMFKDKDSKIWKDTATLNKFVEDTLSNIKKEDILDAFRRLNVDDKGFQQLTDDLGRIVDMAQDKIKNPNRAIDSWERAIREKVKDLDTESAFMKQLLRKAVLDPSKNSDYDRWKDSEDILESFLLRANKDGGVTEEEEVANFQGIIDSLLKGHRDQVEKLILQYNQETDKDKQSSIADKIDTIINTINAFPNEDLQGSESLKLNEFLQGPNAKTYKTQARNYLLNGEYVPEFIFAGAATRLFSGLEEIFGKGKLNPADYRMYGLDLWSVVRLLQSNIEQVRQYDSGLADAIRDVKVPADALPYGMGQRQIAAYRKHLENLAQASGQDVRQVLARQKIVLHISDEIKDMVLNDFVDKDFYGFNPQNVFFIVQPAFGGFSFDQNGQLVYDQAGMKLPMGHGYVMMQMVRPGEAFTIDSGGKKTSLKGSVIDNLTGAKMIGTHRVNDLTKFLPETVANVDKVAFGLYLMDNENKDVVVELVDNLTGQKGGNLLQDSNGNKLLIETLNIKGSKKLTELLDEIAKNGAPYNAFRLMIKPEVYKNVYEEEIMKGGLTIAEKSNLRFKDGKLYIETVGGNDITQSKASNVEAIRNPGEVIQDFKELKNFSNTKALETLADSDKALKDGGEQGAPEKAGGIDFRTLPFTQQSVLNLAANELAIAKMTTSRQIDLDSEWSSLEQLIAQGSTVPENRIKEYLAACCNEKKVANQSDRMLVCVVAMMRTEEEEVLPTSPEVKELLAFLNSRR